jgi:hypothetical protein
MKINILPSILYFSFTSLLLTYYLLYFLVI